MADRQGQTKGLSAKAESTVDSPSASEDNIDEVRERVLARQRLEQSAPPALPITTLFRKGEQHALDQVATQPSVFDDPGTAKYFQPHPNYENLHRFDPNERWTWAEELPLINKLDWKVTLWACIAFFALDLDRGNLSQANTDNFLDDLNLNTNDYNLGNTIFRVAFLSAELPSQLVSKKLGPDRWIPAQMIMWSVVASSQFWLSGRSSFLACRFLLGFIQGGFIPDVILYLSYFFKGTELPFRLALFWTTLRVTDIVSPLLGYGLLRLRGHQGYEGWRWLFLVEGLLTLSVGIWSIFMMAPSPTQTKAWYRPKGWFSEREEKIMVNRILRDDPSKGDMHNRQAITFKLLWKSITDWDLWPIYILGLVFGIPAGPPDQYLTLTLRRLGFNTLNSNLLTIPAQVLGTISMLALVFVSESINERTLISLLSQAWLLPCLIALTVIPASTSSWAQYALVTILISYPYPHPIHVGWCSRNSNTVRTRTVSAAIYNMFVQASGVIYSNIYRDDDKPMYRRGNRTLTAIAAANIVIYVLVKAYYVWRNKQRASAWNKLSEEEKIHYLETTTDSGSKRKDFQFAH